jgi:hypothetical protein
MRRAGYPARRSAGVRTTLVAGEYFCDCSLHPNMTGMLIAES